MAARADASRPGAIASAMVFGIAAATILAALAFEHIGNHAPCPLCLEQRNAYYFAVPASAAAYILAQYNFWTAAWVLLALIAVAFLFNAGLGTYHAGIEWDLWEGPASCSGGTAIEWGEGGLARQMESVQVVRCDEAALHVLGFSLSVWNALISLALAAIAMFGATQWRR
ncbi:MAG: disulfide bond formation protein B [Methyloceanibacter sp.]|uniref:disulfide bond formation protein B n=1 Tax=Methyloceanibacter sp. TaxID=1965321 RepID=UPI003D9B0098